MKGLTILFFPCWAQVGDGTTSVTLLAAEFLKQLKPYVEEGLHPQTIIRAFRSATNLAVNKIKEISVSVKKDDRQYVLSVALTHFLIPHLCL